MSSTPINLRIPGPTPLPPEVREALSQQIISHRGVEYSQLHGEIVTLASEFFQTTNDLFIYTSSGTGMMEASIANTLCPGDKVLAVSIGNFGNRFIKVAKAFHMDVETLEYPQGQAAKAAEVAQLVAQNPTIKAVIITHNETSSGIENPLSEIVPAVRGVSPSILFLVDSVSGMGNVDLPVDELDLDVVFTSTQKAWMSPPGLALVSISPRAWEAAKSAKSPRYYFDFANMKKFQAKNQTPETPAVSTMFALRQALRMMKKRGVKETFAFYNELSAYTRQQLEKHNFKLFGDQSHASKTVTACWLPEGLEDKEFRGLAKKKYHTILASGMGEMEGKLFRVAHMGWVTKQDIDTTVDALVKVREELQK